MDTRQVAQQLIQSCRTGDFSTPYEQIYSEDVVSVEPMHGLNMGGPRETVGLDAVLAKGDKWGEMFEIHSVEVEGPFLDNDQFAAIFKLDLTHRQSGERNTVTELALYKVQNGKIVREEFMPSI